MALSPKAGASFHVFHISRLLIVTSRFPCSLSSACSNLVPASLVIISIVLVSFFLLLWVLGTFFLFSHNKRRVFCLTHHAFKCLHLDPHQAPAFPAVTEMLLGHHGQVHDDPAAFLWQYFWIWHSTKDSWTIDRRRQSTLSWPWSPLPRQLGTQPSPPCDVHATRSSHVSAIGLCDIWPCQASPPSLTLWSAPRLFCQLHRPPSWPPELYLFCSLMLVFWKWISAQRTTFPWACQGRSVTGSQPFAINA